MRVFEFLDEHPELSQLKTVQHFRALPQGAYFGVLGPLVCSGDGGN